MSSRLLVRGAAGAAAALAMAAVGVLPAQSAAADIVPAPGADLVLTIYPASPTTGAAFKQVTLVCDPDGGTHPSPVTACDSLRKVAGYFEKLPNAQGSACPAVYDPVTGVATGTWQGRKVEFQRTMYNACALAISTDNVFKF